VDINLKDLHLVTDVSTLVVLLGLLWKVSRLVQKVDLMWNVFAREHGLNGNGEVRRKR
jgi:hypothetical protein